MYLIFGTLTTVVNIVVYYLFSNIIHLNYLFSNAVAWFLSGLFAILQIENMCLIVVVHKYLKKLYHSLVQD